MSKRKAELSLEEELLILQFWACGKDVLRKLGPEKTRAVSGLEEAVQIASTLPAAIGWDEDEELGETGWDEA